MSFWERQKNNFKHLNKKEFAIDSILITDFEANIFKKLKHTLLDSIIGNPGYLYSWQNRDSTKNEFTIINDDGELGLKLFYFVLDKKDSLLSWMQIGGKGIEGGYSFETRSKFISKDTILTIGAITQLWNFDTQKRMEKTKGDTTFSYITIDKKGKMTEKIFKEVKHLHFENK